jgi:ATP synthase protein I
MSREPASDADRKALLRGVGLYGTVGLEMVLATLLGWWIGARLDEWCGTGPWLTVLFLAAGVGAAVKRVVTVVRHALREEGDEEASRRL